ncbi:MAG: MATE family efflux transporter [Clostridia bacterium]|nr:MATE family efflux transporter [Clostridia bacterium]
MEENKNVDAAEGVQEAAEIQVEVKPRNKMAISSVGKLIWKLGLPLIVSLVLQAVYNIVDTAFVINMGEDGVAGNLALTYAFPIQLLIIAVGVGTGVGVNAMLSKSLGEGNKQKADRVAGNGIFLAFVIYAVFLIFGIFGAGWFIRMQSGENEQVAEMGARYLQICCCLSFGTVGFTIYERFLQSTGRTLFSTISQVSGAVLNVILDYVFIYPLGWGVEGAAWATVIGQATSMGLAMLFHYLTNKEIGNHIKNLKPSWNIIKEIYHIGLSAAIMQGLLSVMMLGVTLILGTAQDSVELLKGSFGIYYKIMQFALFACFGLSNCIISVLAFNYGMQDKQRSKQCVKWGIIDTLIVSAIVTALFEGLAEPLANLFGMASGEGGEEITATVVTAIRISSIGYLFMGFSTAVQGVLQALRYALFPLIISALRLVVFVMPAVWLFTLTANPALTVWWAFPIAEVLTAAVSVPLLIFPYKKKLKEI